MSLTKPSIELLIDMVENRLSDMVVTDREDAKEQMLLKRALQELAGASLSHERSARRKAVAAMISRAAPEKDEVLVDDIEADEDLLVAGGDDADLDAELLEEDADENVSLDDLTEVGGPDEEP